MTKIHKGLFKDVTYNLYNADGILEEHQGLYLLCDGRYHKWRCLQCPLKHTANLGAARWSCHLESVRKDVEGLFGILKQRFRILKNAVEIHDQEDIDNIFFTCCILNNMLLKFDGYDKRWDFLDKEWEHN